MEPGPGRSNILLDKPFTRLKERTYLHNRPRPETYGVLIDCFRMRDLDDKNLLGTIIPGGIYDTKRRTPSAIGAFRRFLDLAESRPRLLPEWWDAEARTEVSHVRKSTTSSRVTNLIAAV
jgi:mitochondrial splicing suppressor protein 51